MEPFNYSVAGVDRDAPNDKKYQYPSELPDRPGKNTAGKQIKISLNQYKVKEWPQKDVWQYDVSYHSRSPFSRSLESP